MNHTNVTPHLGSTVRHKATGLEGLVSWLEDAENHRTALLKTNQGEELISVASLLRDFAVTAPRRELIAVERITLNGHHAPTGYGVVKHPGPGAIWLEPAPLDIAA